VSVIAFDTLKFCKRLEQAGIPADHAAATASAFADAMTDALATKLDIAALRAEVVEVRSELRTEIVAVRTEIATVRTEIAAQRTETKRDLAELELRMTVKLGAMMMVSVGAVATLVKLL